MGGAGGGEASSLAPPLAHPLGVNRWELILAKQVNLKSLVFGRIRGQNRPAPDQKMLTKRPSNWSPGLILSAFRTVFEPDPLERVSGPSSAGNRPKTKSKFKFYLC